MTTQLNNLIKEIDKLNDRLTEEYQKASKQYSFFIKQKKIEFSQAARARNKKFKIPLRRYLVPKNLRHLVSAPFIYSVVFPLVFLDIVVSIYHAVAFPLYRIPKVKRSDYINFDRRYLDYLNLLQKVNCLYCSYTNGLIAYVMEIAARTERYWCPIKAAQKPKFHHTWYSDFADYGEPKEWRQKFNQPDAFKQLES